MGEEGLKKYPDAPVLLTTPVQGSGGVEKAACSSVVRPSAMCSERPRMSAALHSMYLSSMSMCC